MAFSKSTFLALFDEFEGVPSKKINAWAEFASHRVDEKAWGKCADEAIYYLTAHMLASTGGIGGSGGANAGPVTSESVGQLSRSYGQVNVGNGNDELLATTRYGQQFIELRRTCVIPATVSCATYPGSRNGIA